MPAFSIDDFRNHYSAHNEVSKTDKFDVYFSLPSLVAGDVTTRDLALQCEASELPGKDVAMIEYRHYSFTQRLPHHSIFAPINFTFYCTGDLIEKKLFDRWMDIMAPAETGLIMYPQDSTGAHNYDTQILVNQYDNQGTLIYSITLVDAVPISVSPMALSWQDDSVHRLSVTFAYKKWTSNQTSFNSVNDFSNIMNASPETLRNASGDGVNNYTNVNQSPNRDQRLPSVIPSVVGLGGRLSNGRNESGTSLANQLLNSIL